MFVVLGFSGFAFSSFGLIGGVLILFLDATFRSIPIGVDDSSHLHAHAIACLLTNGLRTQFYFGSSFSSSTGGYLLKISAPFASASASMFLWFLTRLLISTSYLSISFMNSSQILIPAPNMAALAPTSAPA